MQPLMRLLLMCCLLAMASLPEVVAKPVGQAGLQLVGKILRDPLIAPSARNARLVFVGSKTESVFTISRYNLVPVQAGKKSVGRCELSTLHSRKSDTSFDLALVNDDVTRGAKEPKWDKLVPQWDSFVNRYWPNTERITDWKEEKWRFQSSQPVFVLHYVLKKQEVRAMTISLKVRLTDGKIGGIYALDFRGDWFRKPIPPRPSIAKITALVPNALPKFKYWPKSRTIKNLRAVASTRHHSRLGTWDTEIYKQNRFGFNTVVKYHGTTVRGQKVEVRVEYDEARRSLYVMSIQLLEPEILGKPFTPAADGKPSWNHAKELWFSSTRDVEQRPWWERDSIVLSTAVLSNSQQKGNGVQFVRPVKPAKLDFQAYAQPLPSPSGKYLAALQGARDNELFLLDLPSGLLFFPEPAARLKSTALQQGARPEEIQPLRLEIAGAAWLQSENGLVLSITNKDRDPNLYVARWEKGQPPQEMELVPIVVELGDDVLPELGADGKSLAWARKIYKRERDKAPDEKDRWQFLLADFDAESLTTKAPRPEPGQVVYETTAIAALNTRNRRLLDLPDEPLSIAWDQSRSRWLVVTRTQVLWVSEQDGKLSAQAAPSLQWKSIALRPTGADVSREGKIAIAAELATPQVYPKTECVVRSLIFAWDGASTSAQPMYDPSLNGLPRYVFPATKSTWARIVGDPKRLGLEGSVDPAAFVASAPTARANP